MSVHEQKDGTFRWGCICGDKGIEPTDEEARDAFLIHECGVVEKAWK